MNILLVSEYFPPVVQGGGEISVYILAKNLAKKGIEVSVLTSGFKGLKKYELKEGIKIYRKLKTRKDPSSVWSNVTRTFYFQKSLKKQLKNMQSNFDIVHFLNTTSIPRFKVNSKTFATINSYTNFCPKRNLFYKEKAACSGCNFGKFIGCMMHSEFVGKTKMNVLLKYNPVFWLFLYLNYKKSNKALRNIDYFIAISDFIKSQLLKSGIKQVQIKKIPNLADIKDSGKKFKIGEKGVLITYVGALEKIKGVEMLIKAFNELGDENSRLLIFGNGSQKKHLENVAGQNIRFYGKVSQEHIPSIYRQSDVIVQPALWPEPFSRVLLEATYFSKPIIATAAGGNPEGVVDGKNGFLIRNKSELKSTMEKLIKSKSLRNKLGKESKRLFKKSFDITGLLKSILNFYEK